MPDRELARARLVAQGLVEPASDDPVEVVRTAGAMQGQDAPGVLASIALRTTTGQLGPVVAAFNSGHLVRGYPMRGTVFAVAAADLTWITQLCAGPAIAAAVRRRPQLDLEERHFALATQVLQELPSEGVDRDALMAAWGRAGIDPAHGRGYHVLAHLIATGQAVHGSISDGGFRVHFAPAWLPSGTDLESVFNGDQVAATAELFTRYARSRGPVTVRDFAWWTKLPLTRIRQAVKQCGDRLDHDVEPGSGQLRYWRPGLFEQIDRLASRIDRGRLLPGFDEFILGYQDRMFAIDAEHHEQLVPGNNGIFQKGALRGGRVVGTWRAVRSPATRTSPVKTRTVEATLAPSPTRTRRLEVNTFGPVGQGIQRQWERCFEQFPFLD